jgi:hypothetical protein
MSISGNRCPIEERCPAAPQLTSTQDLLGAKMEPLGYASTVLDGKFSNQTWSILPTSSRENAVILDARLCLLLAKRSSLSHSTRRQRLTIVGWRALPLGAASANRRKDARAGRLSHLS